MKKKVRYIITKASDDGTLQEFDRVMLCADGCLICYTAGGWLKADDVPGALNGAGYVVDKDYYKKLRENLTLAGEI